MAPKGAATASATLTLPDRPKAEGGFEPLLDDMIGLADVVLALCKGHVLFAFGSDCPLSKRAGLRQERNSDARVRFGLVGERAALAQDVYDVLARSGVEPLPLQAQPKTSSEARARVEAAIDAPALLTRAFAVARSLPAAAHSHADVKLDLGFVPSTLRRFDIFERAAVEAQSRLGSSHQRMADAVLKARRALVSGLARELTKMGAQSDAVAAVEASALADERLQSALDEWDSIRSETISNDKRFEGTYNVVVVLDEYEAHAAVAPAQPASASAADVRLGQFLQPSHWGFDAASPEWKRTRDAYMSQGVAIRAPQNVLKCLRGDSPKLKSPSIEEGGLAAEACAEIFLTLCAAHADVGMAVLGCQLVAARSPSDERKRIESARPKGYERYALAPRLSRKDARDAFVTQQIFPLFTLERAKSTLNAELRRASAEVALELDSVKPNGSQRAEATYKREVEELRAFFASGAQADSPERAVSEQMALELVKRHQQEVLALQNVTPTVAGARVRAAVRRHCDKLAERGAQTAALLWRAAQAGLLWLDAKADNVAVRADGELRLIDIDPSFSFLLRGVRPATLFLIHATLFFFNTALWQRSLEPCGAEYFGDPHVVDYFLKPLRRAIIRVQNDESRRSGEGDPFEDAFASIAVGANMAQPSPASGPDASNNYGLAAALRRVNEIAYYTRAADAGDDEQNTRGLAKKVATTFQYLLSYYVVRELDPVPKFFQSHPGHALRDPDSNQKLPARRGRMPLRPSQLRTLKSAGMLRYPGNSGDSTLEALLKLMTETRSKLATTAPPLDMLAPGAGVWPANSERYDYSDKVTYDVSSAARPLLSADEPSRLTGSWEDGRPRLRTAELAPDARVARVADFKQVLGDSVAAAGLTDGGFVASFDFDDSLLAEARGALAGSVLGRRPRSPASEAAAGAAGTSVNVDASAATLSSSAEPSDGGPSGALRPDWRRPDLA